MSGILVINFSAARVPAIVNFSLGAPNRSPHKHQTSTSPRRPATIPNGQPSERRSPATKAVQMVVLGEEVGGGENPINHGSRNQKWFKDGGDLAESALKAVREGHVITTNERSYPSPADNRKKRTFKAKESVSNQYPFS